VDSVDQYVSGATEVGIAPAEFFIGRAARFILLRDHGSYRIGGAQEYQKYLFPDRAIVGGLVGIDAEPEVPSKMSHKVNSCNSHRTLPQLTSKTAG